MKVKELMQVVTSATVIKAWANRTASETDGEYIGSFGVHREFVEQFGDYDVIGVYPEKKDYLYVSIEISPWDMVALRNDDEKSVIELLKERKEELENANPNASLEWIEDKLHDYAYDNIGIYNDEIKKEIEMMCSVQKKRTRKCKKVYWYRGRDGKLYSQNYMDGMFGIEQDEISGWQIRTFGMKTKKSAIKYSFGRELIEYSL